MSEYKNNKHMGNFYLFLLMNIKITRAWILVIYQYENYKHMVN